MFIKNVPELASPTTALCFLTSVHKIRNSETKTFPARRQHKISQKAHNKCQRFDRRCYRAPAPHPVQGFTNQANK